MGRRVVVVVGRRGGGWEKKITSDKLISQCKSFAVVPSPVLD